MPRVKNLDDFLELSTDLLCNFPSTTTLSVTYTNVSKKAKAKSTKSKKPIEKARKHIPTTHAVKIKFFEPHTGKCIKYKTIKQKELSRILNMLGPQGISNNIGLASLMANCKFEPTSTEAEHTAAGEESSKVADDAATEGGATSLSTGDSSSAGHAPTSLKKKNKKKKNKN
ncbi:hypothetical protein KGF56_002245 [Candida oxycetoniae]|uniref:SRP9 domain-containing protein n=1 Tax=Candida oxycetoniae TaxID=497107 RepID=A0AAI9SY67_9ASCO|nr:uncharacterized protein KGF56_002245 [Candida oxycetoniae]KAI3404916.2 hypothetical protein KGF56_002245 [Candida oxycetoniae]